MLELAPPNVVHSNASDHLGAALYFTYVGVHPPQLIDLYLTATTLVVQVSLRFRLRVRVRVRLRLRIRLRIRIRLRVRVS